VPLGLAFATSDLIEGCDLAADEIVDPDARFCNCFEQGIASFRCESGALRRRVDDAFDSGKTWNRPGQRDGGWEPIGSLMTAAIISTIAGPSITKHPNLDRFRRDDDAVKVAID
jgi:hypothetical protein